jgi:hypothetical protein
LKLKEKKKKRLKSKLVFSLRFGYLLLRKSQ